jgi:tetratricopeptide (TPR) repeat protein
MIEHDPACAGGEAAGGTAMPPRQRPEETVDLVARTIARAQLDRPQRDIPAAPGSLTPAATTREGLLGAVGLAALAAGLDGGNGADRRGGLADDLDELDADDAGYEDDLDLGPHPSTEILWRFMTGGLEPAEMRLALRHLLHGCQACQEVARDVWNLTPTSAVVPAPGVAIVPIAAMPPAHATDPTDPGRPAAGARERDEAGPVDELDAAYDAVLDRVFARVSAQEAAIEAARRRSAGLFEELMQHPPARQELLVNNSTRFRDRMLCESLVSAGHDAGFRDPVRSQHLARLAVATAERLSEQARAVGKAEVEEPGGLASLAVEKGSFDLLDGLRARAWAQLGNALRIGADLAGASAAFDAAEAVLAANPRVGLLDVARVLDLRASLYRDLRQLQAAGRLLDRVIGIYRRLGQSNLLGRVLNQKAMVLAEAGDAKSSMALLRRALDLLDPREEPRWFLTVRHNLICTLLAESRPREAFALLFHTRPLYLKMGDRMNLLRLRWVEGAVAQALDRLEQAEAAFREVRDAFVELGIAYDAALVALDLAAVYARQGRTTEVRRLAQEMMTFFGARQIHREAMAAFLFFCDAVRVEQAAGGMLRVAQDVASFLKQARNAPTLRYSPRGASS